MVIQNGNPVNQVPGAQTTNEDTTLYITGLGVTDPDAVWTTDIMTITLSVQHGTIYVRGYISCVVINNNTNSVTITGSVNAINNMMATTSSQIQYTPDLNYVGPDILTMTTSDNGNRGGTGPAYDIDTVAITVTPINDAPVNTVPDPVFVTKGGVLDVTGLHVLDVDSATNPIKVTLKGAQAEGAFTFNSTAAAAAGVTITNTSNATWSMSDISGTVDHINAFLATPGAVTWTPLATYTGVTNLTMDTSDLGNVGSGGIKTDSDTFTVYVTAPNTSTTANRAPVNTIGTAKTLAEDSYVMLTGLGIADPDAVPATDIFTVTLSVQHGTLLVSGYSGVTVLDSGTNSVTFSGTMNAVNNMLALSTSVKYIPDANYNGTDTLTMLTSDNGLRGTGGALTDTDTIGITISPVNDAPTNVLPLEFFTSEDTNVVLPGVQIADIDSPTATFTVTLAVTNGTLTVLAGTGVTLATNNTASVKLTGTMSAINTLLATNNALTYKPNANYNGNASLTITTSDGTALTTTDSVAIYVAPVDDAPVLATPGTLAYTENGAAAAISTTMVVTDIDDTTMSLGSVSIGTGFQAGFDVLSFTSSATTGNIVGTYDATTGVLSLSSAGSTATNAMWYLAFRAVKFSSTSDVPGTTRSIAYVVNDGQLDSNVINATVNITAVNDAPVNIVPGAQTGTEDTPLVITGLQTSDIDSPTATFTVTLAVTNGTLNVAAGTGVTLATNGTASVKLTGTLSAINALLASTNAVTFTPTLNYNGAATLTMTTSDSALTDVDTVAITLAPVNDHPVVTPSATAAAYTENAAAVVVNSALTVTDIDSTNITGAKITISGGFTAGDLLAFTAANGITGTYANGVLTLTGTTTVANYQAALRTVTYSSTSDIPTSVSATRTLSWEVDDGATVDHLSNIGTSTINVTKVNDLPTGTVVINGTATTGSVLTASNTLADADGLGAITYTWYAGGVAITGATGPTYTVLAADAGKIFTVKASYTDTQGTAEAVTSAAVAYTVPGQATVNLGTTGNLIAPIQVEGKWYYYLDSNKSGAADNGDILYDHNYYDSIFKYDINGNLNPNAGTDTSEVYRYAYLNGTLVGMIPLNGNKVTDTTGQVSIVPTAASGTSTTNSTTYDDFLAIWDATNGTVTSGTNVWGTPTGWLASYYWTATMTTAGNHVVLNPYGWATSTVDSFSPYVTALEVVNPNSAPVLTDTALSLSSIGTGVTAPVNGNTTAGVLVTSLMGGVTDADVGALGGIAITGAAAGTVYYSLNGGTNWLSVASTALSDTNALRLAADSNTRVFFKPTTATIGTSDVLTFRAWDQTYGTEGTFADTTANGGRAMFSTAHDTVSLTVAPVALDMNQDGQITYHSVAMDINSDGKLEQTQWVGKQDGVLVWDRYLDGLIHDNSQYAFSQYGGNTDLEGLAVGFDTNHDGKFDVKDAKFGEFMIWQDLNQNGVADAGEMQTLASHGVTSIGLVSDGVQRTPVAGVVEEGHATATMTDGSTMLVADVSFAHDTLAYTLDTSAITGTRLSLTGGNMSLDLSSFLAKDATIAEVDLTGTGNNTIKVSFADVLQQAKSNHAALRIVGNDGDVINLSSGGHDYAESQTVVNGQAYTGYDLDVNGSIDLLVQHNVRVNSVT